MEYKKIINSSKFKYLSYVLVGQIVFMISTLFINYKIEKVWGGEGFAAFSLIKRTTAFIVFPLIFGAGIAIPRFISFQKEKLNQNSLEYLVSGFYLFMGTFSLFLLSIFLFPEVLSNSFRETSFSIPKLILAIIVFVFSQGIYILIFSFYRGKMLFKHSTLLNMLIMSFLPVFTLFFVKDIVDFFLTSSILSLVILIALFISFFRKVRINFNETAQKFKRIFKFGGQRVIGEIALFSLDFFPIYLISISIGLIESGYFSMSLLLLKLASMFFELIGSIVLPYFGKMYTSQTKEYFIKKVRELLIFGVLVAILVSFIFHFLSIFIIQNFFTSQIRAIEATKAMFFVFPIYVVYILLRNIIDIVSDFPYNSVTLTVAVLFQIGILFVGFYYDNSTIYHNLALVIPHTIIGTLALLTWKKLKSRI